MLYLFDIDGTLIGGDGAGRRSFERACHNVMGIAGALTHIQLDGMTDKLILESVFEVHVGRRATEAEEQAIFAGYVGELESEMRTSAFHVKPAVGEILQHLESRGAVIGLATGNLEAGARIKLRRAELWHRFPFGGFGSDATERAELVRVAIARGVERAGRTLMRDEIFVIGDTPRDIAAAHAAGARCVAVATGSCSLDSLRDAGADFAYPSLREYLESLTSS